MTAPPRLNSGEYGEWEPPDNSSGAIREPM